MTGRGQRGASVGQWPGLPSWGTALALALFAGLPASGCGAEPSEPAAMRIVSVAPEAVAAGATVVVRGVGFGATQAGGFVTIRSTVCPVAAWTDDEIRVRVPPMEPGETVLVVSRAALRSQPAPITIVP
ncbi:MAG: hypothetical protein D6729_12950 [Deltaproteobacteria bacterium]|nr:MAG: hypothetical protein D6729_12950 [Deltaproteobacteria bacterium]